MRDADGDRVGTVWLTQKRGSVVVSAELSSLSRGFHGFHVHQTGSCDPNASGGAFTTAGGHYERNAPDTHGNHAGDLPSLLATRHGQAWLAFVTDRFGLRELRAGDGSAVIVHEGRDNFANIPTRYAASPDATTLDTGDAGGRVACGEIH